MVNCDELTRTTENLTL